jgi:hypothetical protein
MSKLIDTSSRLPAVKSAVKLLAIGLLVMVAKFPFSKEYGMLENFYTTIFMLVAVLLINLIWFYKILLGANWARILLLISFVLAEVPYSILAFFEFQSSPTIAVLTLLGLTIDSYAIYLLFTKPASMWFKKDNQEIKS